MKRQLLRNDYIPLQVGSQLVRESREQNGGKLILSGVIQKANTGNQNKRIYPRDILLREVENYGKCIRENRSYGELDHPDSSTVSLGRVSHLVREIWWDGDNVMGRIEILPTKHGMEAAALIESGVTLGISSRGVGSTERNHEGLDIVQPDFQIICWDLVSEPSTPGAYLFSEGKVLVDPPEMRKADRIFRALNEALSYPRRG
jgi:hypothetical protein